jgi:hypothetical protein
MRVSDIRVISLADGCELRARVVCERERAPYSDRVIEPFDLWYRFPAWCRVFLSPNNGDPFLAALLVPAMTLGERLEIPAPVSPAILRALPEIQDILHCFDPRQARIEVAAPIRDEPLPRNDEMQRTGLFFSLGVDSFYSLLENERDHPRDAKTITHLITVHCMEVWHEAWDERFPPTFLANSQRVAAAFGKTLTPVTTNLRAMTDDLALWPMSHGGGLASIALALGTFFGTVHIAATTTYDKLFPWGSHPVLDPLWSTEDVRFVHDGCEMDRIDKTRIVAASPLALETLQVCPGYTAEYNCGRCAKCLRTMIDLLQAGALDRCQTLPHRVDAEQLRRSLAGYHGRHPPLSLAGYRRRRDAFTDDVHADLRAALTDFLATEGQPTRTQPQPAPGSPRDGDRPFLGWIRRQRRTQSWQD